MLGIGSMLMQFWVSFRNRAALRDVTGDPWGGRTLEWSTSSPPPDYNFAFTPHVYENDTWADMKQAGLLFEQAIEKDSNFALAYAGLADSSLRLYGESKESIWAQKATLAAQRADQLASSLPEVHLSLGSVYSATGKNAQAITEIKQALALAPNSDEAYRLLGDAYRANGQSEEAIAAYEKAVSVNAYFWMNHNALGQALSDTGDTAKALLSFQKVIELEIRLSRDKIMVLNHLGSNQIPAAIEGGVDDLDR